MENRGAFSPRGARALQAELRAKGVDQARIDEVLDEKDAAEDERAYQAGLKRLRLLARCDEDEFRQRMGAFLQRRGFDYETARSAAERLCCVNRRLDCELVRKAGPPAWLHGLLRRHYSLAPCALRCRHPHAG